MAVAEVVVAVVTMLLGLTLCTTSSAAAGSARWREEVTYDHRALVMNGTRRMLFAGEMHYPRSTPEILHKDRAEMSPMTELISELSFGLSPEQYEFPIKLVVDFMACTSMA